MKPCDKNTLLVVDDEEHIVKMFSFVIRAGFPSLLVETASNGAEAVEAFLKKHHAIIVMDVRMPVMDGLEAFEKIQEECRKRDWEMPSVTFCTGYVPPTSLSQLKSLGEQHGLLLKPITSSELADTVRERLNSIAE